jgi:8-oxo-dGTP pyrophosphatase MutT (NUDIX family)
MKDWLKWKELWIREPELQKSDRPWLPEAKPAAVLVALRGDPHDPSFLLIERSEKPEDPHRGQLALPGGRWEPEDGEHLGEASWESLDPWLQTAHRETEEEVGISRNQLQPLGRLPWICTPSGYQVHPIVSVIVGELSELCLAEDEVASAFWVPTGCLLMEQNWSFEKRQWRGQEFSVPSFHYQEHRVWGATGTILRFLKDRLELLY